MKKQVIAVLVLAPLGLWLAFNSVFNSSSLTTPDDYNLAAPVNPVAVNLALGSDSLAVGALAPDGSIDSRPADVVEMARANHNPLEGISAEQLENLPDAVRAALEDNSEVEAVERSLANQRWQDFPEAVQVAIADLDLEALSSEEFKHARWQQAMATAVFNKNAKEYAEENPSLPSVENLPQAARLALDGLNL